MRIGGEGVPTSDNENLFYFGSPGALNWVLRSQKELTEASRSQNELFYNCSTEYSHYYHPPHHSVESVELYCVCLSVCLTRGYRGLRQKDLHLSQNILLGPFAEVGPFRKGNQGKSYWV